ncbi:hypothetical protein CIRG_01137 [Coccidioides immitis RMSCC 2394]|uniref:Aminoglycoside phosphotransferase domain-containing protein n=1 Tax=Coccidioides immitis RMSCC 2394 TaxID=404692 RepID=A0A0J7AUM0_COCIT|nr:hypothetical protein CIRG_01137 [Coccidioides immitis RMSCC 2394]
MLLQLYRLIPQSIRLLLYRLLLPIGEHLYGSGTYHVRDVQRLPFNLYLKRSRLLRVQYEAHALKMVAEYTTLNAPRVVDFIELPAKREGWLLTNCIEGDIAGKCLQTMNAEQLHQFSIDFRNYVEQIRSLGGECQDCRIDNEDGSTGPYDNIADFNKHLMDMCGLIPNPADRAVIANVHSRSYRVFFTHADLNPANVLVHSGRLSGFVDWEFAGWYPEYWEFTKACYIVRIWTLWLEMMKGAFPEYPDELKAEQILRDHTCPF